MSLIVMLTISEDSTREDSTRYIKDVLGHGGCNVFPEYKGECGCPRKTKFLSNTRQRGTCPICGSSVNMEIGQSFSDWVSKNWASRNYAREWLPVAFGPKGNLSR